MGTRTTRSKLGEIIKSIQLPSPCLESARFINAQSVEPTRNGRWLSLLLAASSQMKMSRSFTLQSEGSRQCPFVFPLSNPIVRGASATSDTIARAAEQSAIGAQPLPMTRYKLVLLKGLVEDVLGTLIAQIS